MPSVCDVLAILRKGKKLYVSQPEKGQPYKVGTIIVAPFLRLGEYEQELSMN